jgi:hypothetical protein
MLARVPDAYMKGREQGRTIAKEDAFKKGMPVLKDDPAPHGNPRLGTIPRASVTG